jgi:hypothetical protein
LAGPVQGLRARCVRHAHGTAHVRFRG